MTDEKDPLQESVKADSLDDEIIIDLTDEVVIKTENDNDNGFLGFAEDLADDAPKAVEEDKASEVPADEKNIALIEESLGADEDEAGNGTTESDLKPSDDEDVIIIDNTLEETDEALGAMVDDETVEAQRNADVSDPEENIELDFEPDEDDKQFIDLDEERAEDDQDLVNLVLGESKGSDQSDDEEKPAQYIGFEPKEQEGAIALEADQDDDTKIAAIAEEDPLKFESDQGFFDSDQRAGREADDEVIPLDGFNDLESQNEEDIIEITEFDQHFSTEAEALKKQSGTLDASDADEKEFLDLIDVEEDILAEDEKSDFNLDSNAFAQQVNRFDAFLSQNSAKQPEVASFPATQAKEAQTGPENSEIGRDLDEPLRVPPGQIDAAIERVINEKFSGKIEDIIYEVIEKAVAKEIDRLKGALIGNNKIDDNLS